MSDVVGASGSGGAPGGDDQGPSGGGNQPNGDICAFCLDPIDDSTACFSTACPLHISHKDCILPWLRNNRSCATCRTPVTKLRMRSGKCVPLPPLVIPEIDPAEEPPLSEEAYAAGVGLDSDDDSSDDDFISPADREQRAANRRQRRSDRNLASIIDNIFGMNRMIDAYPSETRRSRRNLLNAGTSRGSRARSNARAVDLEELEAQMEEERREVRRHQERVILTSSDAEDNMELEEEEEPREERRRRRRRVALSDEETVQVTADESSSEESDSEEDGESEEESEDSDSSLSDSAIHDDQPCSSSTMNPIVRRRGSKKKKSTTRKKRTTTKAGGVKKRKTKRKSTKRSSKKRRPVAEERSEQRHRLRQAIPSLSLNGAGLEPVDDEDMADVFPIESPPSRATPPATAASDPTDLLGSILTSQVVALAPGRYLQQRDGRLEPTDRFSRHLDRLESRGALPVSREEVQPRPSRTQSQSFSITDSPPIDTTRRFDFFAGESNSSVSRPHAERLSDDSETVVKVLPARASTLDADPPRRILATGPPHRTADSSRQISRPAVSSAREVPLVSPFTQSTPLPPLPPSTVFPRAPPSVSSSSSRDPSSVSRPPSDRPSETSRSGSRAFARDSRKETVSRDADTSRRDSRPQIIVPLVSPFTQSTPLPPLPPSVDSSVAPPSSSTADARRRAEANRREEVDRIKRERAAQIRTAVTAILSNPHRKRKISENQRRVIMKKCHHQFFDRLLFDEERTKQFARNAFDDLMNEMMVE